MTMLDDLLLEAGPLYLDNAIDDFGALKNIPASIKHTNGKYIICNIASAQRDGIPIEDYVGLTAYDIGKITNRKRAVTNNAVQMDQRIFSKAAPFVIYQQHLLAHNQSIVIEEVCKRAILGSKDQIAAILACGEDITRHAHPMLLFKLYESYLPRQAAIQNFLKYKKLDTLFRALPSYEELLTLITMRDVSEVGAIKKQLTYSISDIERYQAQLREKVPVIGLEEVLSLLQWHGPDAAQGAVGGLDD